MSSLHSLPSTQKRVSRVSFNRNELRELLNEYSRRVATGEWRDYAIDFKRDRAIFSVFRHTAEHPLYSIEKLAAGKGGGVWRLRRGPQALKQSRELSVVLAAIDRRPKLIAIN
jgi:hypothetical protein